MSCGRVGSLIPRFSNNACILRSAAAIERSEMAPGTRTDCYGVFYRLTEEYATTTRCRFTADFKATVALEALRGRAAAGYDG